MYIIAEIGANHNGDMQLAKEMILSAKQSGADCVKFQSWTPESLVSKEEYDKNQVYTDSKKKHFGSLKEMVVKYALTRDNHFELKKYCNEINIDFSSSPFSNGEIDLLVELDVPFIKIASMDINNHSLLRYAASTQKPMIVSTGMAEIGEIDEAIKIIEAAGNTQITLLHCISIYPPKFEDIHLRNIEMLSQTFGYPVGFSDHSIGIEIPLAAAALGATMIEKHFTTDKDLPGWDHLISADPTELSAIASGTRAIAKSLGSFQRVVSQDELNKRQKFRRSIVINRDLPKGHKLQESDLLYKRPGTGISPNRSDLVIGRRLVKTIEKDTLLNLEMLE
ncbi:N-acetylneuraminate synthase family protein [Schleiferiaceae bacterium]|nr:N-acetylneuraminate synthase family protein [Schleiferiaceae bacterium]